MFFPCPKEPSCLQPRFVSTDPGMMPGRTSMSCKCPHSPILLSATVRSNKHYFHRAECTRNTASASLCFQVWTAWKRTTSPAGKRTKIMMWIMRCTKKHEAHTHSNQDEALRQQEAWQRHGYTNLSTAQGSRSPGRRTNRPLSVSDMTWFYSQSLPEEHTWTLFYLVLK